MTFHVDIFLIS